jgi:hypothetical protein
MSRRLLSIIALCLAVSACVPYYSGGGYYRSEVYTVPAPYYYGGYGPYYGYPRGYHAPPPRYYQGPPHYPQAPGYRSGHGPGYRHGDGSGHGDDRNGGWGWGRQ